MEGFGEVKMTSHLSHWAITQGRHCRVRQLSQSSHNSRGSDTKTSSAVEKREYVSSSGRQVSDSPVSALEECQFSSEMWSLRGHSRFSR